MTRFAARIPRRKLLRSSPLSRRLVRSIQPASSPSRRRSVGGGLAGDPPERDVGVRAEEPALALVLPHEADDLRPRIEQSRFRRRDDRRPAEHGAHVLAPADELVPGLEAGGKVGHPADTPFPLERGEVGRDAREIGLPVGHGAFADRRPHVGAGRGGIAESGQERLEIPHGAGRRRHRRGRRHRSSFHRLSLSMGGPGRGFTSGPSIGPFRLLEPVWKAVCLGWPRRFPALPEISRFCRKPADSRGNQPDAPRHTFPVCRGAVG